MNIEVTLRVDEQGQLHIPDEIQQQLFPGMVVVLMLEDQSEPSNGANGQSPFVDILNRNLSAHDGPRIIYEEGVPVIRGEIAADFDWDAFMNEDREAPMHSYEPLTQ